jgi:glutathione S-transferase
MKLYGTRTSPYVRRVRIVAEMVGADLELVDVSTDEGQTILRTITPIWKVPVLDDGEDSAIFDSAVINEYLIRRYGNRNIRTDSGVGRWRERNLITAIDGALDSAINRFYLIRDGASPDVSYLQKQHARTESAMNWIEKQLDGGWFTDVPRIGLVEIALLTALDWMIFRDMYPVDRHGALTTFREAHADFGPFVHTRPGT